jgi:uncharacterized protein YecE (DUF72 family)
VPIERYYLGCPGWGLKSWVGKLFPAGTKHTEFLERYAEVFNTVEGNTTFYALPSPETVARWRASVPATFRFCFKLPRTVTHEGPLQPNHPALADFLARIAPLRDVLGLVFIQLPAHLGPAELTQLAAFLDALPTELRYAVELRHPGFFTDATTIDDLLGERGIDRVIMDTRGIHSSRSLRFAEVRDRKPNLPVIPRATASHPFVRCVPHEDWDATLPFVETWPPHLAAWIALGKQPYFFMHSPDDIDAPDFAYRFHAMLRAHAAVGELPPWPGAPRQLTFF